MYFTFTGQTYNLVNSFDDNTALYECGNQYVTMQSKRVCGSDRYTVKFHDGCLDPQAETFKARFTGANELEIN
tara:strand:+ start:34041 stop:34259 length:219 start_codon:yes stop_codon:yes gene_type:complete